jgi:hypothetical protein
MALWQEYWVLYVSFTAFTTKYVLRLQSFGSPLNMTQSIVVYCSFLVQLYAYCWFGSELTRLVRLMIIPILIT